MAPRSDTTRSLRLRRLLHLPRVRGTERGQALAEFALLIPLLFVLIMGLIEFALAFSATLGVNRASQNAAHMASIASNLQGADCLVLQQVEQDIDAPNNRANIQRVEIQRTAMTGNVTYATTTWERTGTTACELNDGSTVSVPYTLTSNGYPVSQRCSILLGCPSMTPARSTVDNIGVMIRYRYTWVTPLGTLLPFVGGSSAEGAGWTFQKRNIFRMEPNL